MHSKSGNERQRIVVQPRDRRLLGELALTRIVDREQAKIVAGFGSTSRANGRLLALTRAGLLRRFFLGTTGGARKPFTPYRGKGPSSPESHIAGRGDGTTNYSSATLSSDINSQ